MFGVRGERYINPHDIPAEDFPLMVFSDHTSGIIEFFIKFRTSGAYNHVMWARKAGFFASQGNTYSEVKVDRYMKKGNRLKYVEILGLTAEEKNIIYQSIQEKLARPGWKKRYDWLGILGQAIGVNKLNSPWSEYCSEDAPNHLLKAAQKFQPGRIREVLLSVPRHLSPDALNEFIRRYPDVFGVYGRWEHDQQSEL